MNFGLNFRAMIGAMACLGLNTGISTLMPPMAFSKRDSGTPITSNKSPDGTFTDSKGRRYSKDNKGVIRRIRE